MLLRNSFIFILPLSPFQLPLPTFLSTVGLNRHRAPAFWLPPNSRERIVRFMTGKLVDYFDFRALAEGHLRRPNDCIPQDHHGEPVIDLRFTGAFKAFGNDNRRTGTKVGLLRMHVASFYNKRVVFPITDWSPIHLTISAGRC